MLWASFLFGRYLSPARRSGHASAALLRRLNAVDEGTSGSQRISAPQDAQGYAYQQALSRLG